MISKIYVVFDLMMILPKKISSKPYMNKAICYLANVQISSILFANQCIKLDILWHYLVSTGFP